MPIVLQDGTPLSLQDGSQLLAQGESGTVTLPAAASASAAARALTPSAPAAPASETAQAQPLYPSAPVPPASATAQAYPLTANLPLPAAAAATASAYVPVPAPLTGSAASSAAAAALAPAVPVPLASASASAFALAMVIPPASATAAAFPLAPSAPVPRASAAAAAFMPQPEAPLPGAAAATSLAHPLVPAVVIPPASSRTKARALTPPDGSELSLGYPAGKLDARLELNVGGWTDVTKPYTLWNGSQQASVKSGQPDGAQQPAPASLQVTFDNGDFRFSPRYSGGAYFPNLRQNTPARVSVSSLWGTYLRLEANNSDRASVADTSALHITGSIEVRVEACLSDWQGCVLAARRDGTQPSWYLILNSNGTLTWSWFDSSGTQHSATSSVPLPYTSGTFAVAARMDTSALTFGFYVSDSIDGTYSALGTAFSFSSGIATIRAGNAPLVVGWSSNGIAGQLLGMVTACRLYSGVGGTVVADASFPSQSPGVTAWTDPHGLSWSLSGGAEITARDYRLHAEASSIVPQATTSGSARTIATLQGRLRRLQQGSQPAADSPMRRAEMAQSGSFTPVIYWPMEDGGKATQYGPAIGTNLLSNTSGTALAANDTSFEASAALPQLNGATIGGSVPSYSGATAWTVRFLLKVGQSLPGSGLFANVCRVTLSSGTVRQLDLNVDSGGLMQLIAVNSGGSTVFDTTWVSGFDIQNPKWASIEAIPVSGGKVQYNFVVLAPGATSAIQLGTLPQVTESLGTVTGVQFNCVTPQLTDTVIGHVTFQKAWTSLGVLGAPLNAWRTELAGTRFARICSENGIPCRILGSPALTQALGPQPRGSVWQVLRDTVWADQGILFEPFWAALGMGFRTRASMTGQDAAVSLSFADSNLPGNLLAADDDQGLLNDITASMPDGTQVRVVLDDGSARSVSEPPTGAGRYAGQPPLPFNTSDASGLASVAAFYLTVTSVDSARYRQVTADMGIPGAPAEAIARLRPGDLVTVTDVPGAYQSADISQLVTGATEALGPGRSLTWDCVPASPYS